MRTILNNCRIVNPYGEMPFMENGSILIEDGIIKKLGMLDQPFKWMKRLIYLGKPFYLE